MRAEDVDELYEILNDPDIQRGQSSDSSIPRPEKNRETIKTWSETNPLFVIAVDSATSELIGMTAIWYWGPAIMRNGEMSLMVKKSQWGKGYGTEICSWVVRHGFRFLGLHRISLRVFASNENAVRVYKKAGFVQEGVVRRAHFYDGNWEDILVMGILEEEFAAEGNK